jgi:hypothetical protein
LLVCILVSCSQIEKNVCCRVHVAVFILRRDIQLNVGHFSGVKASDVEMLYSFAMSSLHTNHRRKILFIELTRTSTLIFRALGVLVDEFYIEGDVME